MKKLTFQILCLFSISLIACSGKKNPAPEPLVSPDKAILVTPVQNSVCTTGENQTATQSTVLFDWSDAAHTDKYSITVKNLLNGSISEQESTSSEIKITLPRATPYAWSVTSKSAKTTAIATSDTWKFYSSGIGITSYAPFPAQATYPAAGQAVTITGDTLTLTWDGSDADGDLSAFDVYFGSTSSPPLLGSVNAGVSTMDVKVNTKTIYYWKIISKDVKGNKTDSGVYQFKVN